MKNYKLILSTAIIATMIGCTNPEKYDTPEQLNGVCGELTVNRAVTAITSTATATTKKYVDDGVEGDDIIEAYVTSSDQGGNFYKSISFVTIDGSVGFSMPIDDYNLYTKYEPGRKVFINMKNLYYFKQYGSTVIGDLYNNDTPSIATDDKVGRVAAVSYEKILTASCSSSISEDLLINKLTIQQAQTDANLNKLIELDNVQFSDESLGKKFYDESIFTIGGSTNHSVVDAGGNSVILRASQYATFAAAAIPSGNGKIIGVMTKYGSDYQFMIRTLDDVQLTNPRVAPFFAESFTSNFPAWTKISVTGAQVWSLDTVATHGNPGNCAKMSGFAGSSNANEDWLISPVQNLSLLTGATLSYDTATDFTGNPLTVLISRNYIGSGNPNSATWTTLSGTLAPTDSNYTWTGSGPVNINAFTGIGNNTVYIAFKYTSTNSASATWEVDNVEIESN